MENTTNKKKTSTNLDSALDSFVKDLKIGLAPTLAEEGASISVVFGEINRIREDLRKQKDDD